MCMQRASTGGDLIVRTSRCAPTIETVNNDGGMSYRGTCLGIACEWIGAQRRGENSAVEDAHDHSHPGWRDLPVVRRAAHDAKDKDRDAWRREINRIYTGLNHPAHLLLQGGIIRTERKPHGRRSLTVTMTRS